ncbi:TIGR00282 family metallophosphoesterase [Spiroplasma chrysopicola]|uniref:Putative metallophosphatase n=1 Tax=Spiroplasma chrysopicola DF-1 TaxID=1276227 RepID=R4UA06_9MOLU|nr:TIGR00282 family metallophosphoesterase [Spiroplasma chrysopicola]AGM24689.1 putative metallophosphatase [Spiroplasma chrysopicola DF-1]
MKVLMIGDIFARAGRIVVSKVLPQLIQEYQIDLVVANAENVTHGKSILRQHYDELKDIGVSIFTSGNHIFKNSEVSKYIDEVGDLLKPANMSLYTPGPGTTVVSVKNKTVRITNLMGRSFMDHVDNPYPIFEEIIANDNSDIHLVDFHAEASAEKLAFAWSFDGKITALVGTHTHVQTTDNRILPKGTAYITDLGMCGSFNSIIGAKPEEVITKEKTGLPARFTPSEDLSDLIFSGVVISINEDNNKAEKIERILIHLHNDEDYH